MDGTAQVVANTVTVDISPQKAGISDSGVAITNGGKRVGRPPKYTNCLDLLADIDDYFDTCDEGKLVKGRDKSGREYEEQRAIPYTVGALAIHLGLYGQSWQEELSSRSSDFSDCLKYARGRIESQREVSLLDGSTNVIGSIFWLKARAGWRDTPEVKDSGGIQVIINEAMFSQAKLVGASAPTAIEQANTMTIDIPAQVHTDVHTTPSHAHDDE